MDGLLNPHSHWLLAWYIWLIGCDNPTTARRPTAASANDRPSSRLKRTAPPTPGLVFCFFCLYSFSFIQFNSVCFHFHFSLFSFFPSSILSSILSSLLLFFLLSTFSLSLFSSLTFLSAYLSYSLSLVGSRRSSSILLFPIQPVPSSPEERLPTLGWYILYLFFYYYFCHSLVCSARIDAVQNPVDYHYHHLYYSSYCDALLAASLRCFYLALTCTLNE